MNDPITRQQALDSRLALILKHRDLPALAEHIQELMLRVQDEEITLRQITNIILKDVGLSLRVLRTANSVHYNRSGRPIVTIGHAVALIGLDAIRDLAATLLLVRHFRNSAPGVRHLLALSLLSANHARLAASLTGHKQLEEAYLCGMFRNLGEVLLACYFPRDYVQVLEHMKQKMCSDRMACRTLLGFTYEELGQATITRWNMPDRVAFSMRPETPTRNSLGTEHGRVHALASFGHELTAVMHRDSPEGLRGRMRRMIETHGPLLDLQQRDMEWIAEQAIEETKSTFDMLQIPLDDLRLKAQMEHAISMLKTLDESEFDLTDQLLEDDPEPEPEPPADLFGDMTHEVHSVITEGVFELNQLLMITLEAMQRGGGFPVALFCLVAEDHREIQARLGLGEAIEDLIARFRFPLRRDSGPLSEAMLARHDIVALHGRYLDSDMARAMGAASFLLYPVVVDGVAVGCFYLQSGKKVEEFGEPQRASLSGLRDLAAAAIKMKRVG
ncbi:MAG: HDOD domain-containing protein [Acidimicrobiia bacterium]|nr:HDOD domain-containing protein [Acidimicrobiia bacterium]